VRYVSELDATEARRADLARDLLGSLENGAVRLEYQPIVYVGRGERIVGVEALVRWTHPIHGPVSPEELVQLAEDIGHCDELQRFIVHRATHDAATLVRDHPNDGIFVTVNASPAELRSLTTVQNVQDALATSGLPARSLFVEISERLVDPDEEAVATTMRALRDNGINLLLDDFGEGQTSLSFLHQLPISGIKLDRKLVLNSVRSETERVVVESIVELANRLDMTVIAEGIETQDHLETITRTGCSIVQGYHFHPPLEVTKIRTLLRHQSMSARPWTPATTQSVTTTEVT
jgi:EAL domain-containing protein (putative c-di-GMP-specific phosphodiesterase class I)